MQTRTDPASRQALRSSHVAKCTQGEGWRSLSSNCGTSRDNLRRGHADVAAATGIRGVFLERMGADRRRRLRRRPPAGQSPSPQSGPAATRWTEAPAGATSTAPRSPPQHRTRSPSRRPGAARRRGMRPEAAACGLLSAPLLAAPRPGSRRRDTWTTERPASRNRGDGGDLLDRRVEAGHAHQDVRRRQPHTASRGPRGRDRHQWDLAP